MARVKEKMFSALDMFTVGVGPSSSHTVGPMRAAARFARTLHDDGVIAQVARVQATLYGSLSMTGFGHGSDRAAVAGLEGYIPEDVDTDYMLTIRQEKENSGILHLNGERDIAFNYSKDVVFEQWQRLAIHPNGMRFQAYNNAGECIEEQVWYSIGGGFIKQGQVDDPMIGIHAQLDEKTRRLVEERNSSSDTNRVGEWSTQVPYPFISGDELMSLCREHHMSIAQIMMANENALRPEQETRDYLLHVWRVMRECVHAGCTSNQEVLPGGLDVPRRAKKMYERLSKNNDMLHNNAGRIEAVLEASDAAWVDLYALAVNEENAGGGRVVTAPTNGAAGIVPAVAMYYWHFVQSADDDGIITFLLTAAAVGYLFKRNASISGAEVGCQGEVGVACSMAAAGLASVLGASPAQVENAAEIGIEHNLGLTCDPIGGLVQIPCIERNAMGANTAINAVRVALLGDGSHIVSLDQAIRTMKQTGEDMLEKYKETSRGGLAVNVVEC